MRMLLVTLSIVALTSCAALAENPTAVKALIITGDHGHQWKETTPILKQILIEAGHTDQVAPGRYRPGAPTDPYVRTLTHTVPQITVSLRV